MQSKYYRNYCLTSHLLENQVPRWQFLNDFPSLKPTYFATFLTFTFGKIEWITLKVQCKTQPTPVGKNMALDFLLESNSIFLDLALFLVSVLKAVSAGLEFAFFVAIIGECTLHFSEIHCAQKRLIFCCCLFSGGWMRVYFALCLISRNFLLI